MYDLKSCFGMLQKISFCDISGRCLYLRVESGTVFIELSAVSKDEDIMWTNHRNHNRFDISEMFIWILYSFPKCLQLVLCSLGLIRHSKWNILRPDTHTHTDKNLSFQAPDPHAFPSNMGKINISNDTKVLELGQRKKEKDGIVQQTAE